MKIKYALQTYNKIITHKRVLPQNLVGNAQKNTPKKVIGNDCASGC
jgi:hypothetical protein